MNQSACTSFELRSKERQSALEEHGSRFSLSLLLYCGLHRFVVDIFFKDDQIVQFEHLRVSFGDLKQHPQRVGVPRGVFGYSACCYCCSMETHGSARVYFLNQRMASVAFFQNRPKRLHPKRYGGCSTYFGSMATDLQPC